MAFTVYEEELTRFCVEALEKNGMSPADARRMADVLVQTDMWGIHTHGVKNLNGYILKALAGGVSFTDSPVIERQAGSVAVIDGRNTMGYVSASMAMELACGMAKTSGIAMALVKDSCHFGAAGYYANMAAARGMIGIAMSNVDKKMSVPGARGMVMGHNPFALAAPAASMPSVILDISSSNVASLKVLRAKQNGERVPDTWISDKNGNPTTDPSKYPEEGALLPMGGHKGFGIAMFIEMLTSVLLGCPPSTNDAVSSWCFDLEDPNRVCHTLIAIDPAFMGGSFAERAEGFLTELRAAPKAVGSDGVTIPGENMWKRYERARRQGIELSDDVMEEIRRIEARDGLALKLREAQEDHE